MNPLFGMKIFESELAVTVTPKRKHKRRHNQTEAYHQRIQKKWKKRFGEKHIPAVYQTLMGLVVHPALMPKLRAAAQGEKGE